MTYQEILNNARTCMGPYCKSCPTCNGMACKNTIPGPGAKGIGTGFIRNYQKWQELCVNMDTICENKPVDTSYDFFGKKVVLPVFAAPVGAMQLHYGDKYDDLTYNDLLVSSCAKSGVLAFTGDGTNPAVMEGALHAITAAGGLGVPTVKPWNMETVFAKLDAVRRADPMAVAMDIDAAGLPFLKGLTPPAGSKTVEELRQIIDYAKKPFIIKGVMTVRGALKALEAGASGIVVSNHGGRVLDQCPATAEVLEEIADAVGDSMKILVDGGIRSGTDVFKALALGADAVSIGSAALIAMGCHQCGDCASGRCNWGIATQRADLVSRLAPEAAAERVVNLVSGWNREIQEMMGGMGINAIDSLRGNRLMLRGVGLNEKELEILGVKYAGE